MLKYGVCAMKLLRFLASGCRVLGRGVLTGAVAPVTPGRDGRDPWIFYT